MLAPPGFLRILIHVTAKGFVSAPPSAPRVSITSFLSPPPQTSSVPMVVPPRRKSLGASERLEEVDSSSKNPIAQQAHSDDISDDDATFVSNLFANSSPKATHLSIMESTQALPDLSTLLFAGRPNLAEILEEEINATDFSDYLAVGTCGPTGMTTGMANVVSDAIQLDKVLRGEHRRNIVRNNPFRACCR